jgi:glycosyltransferase involved in cell wall biosynthesis
MRVAFFGLHECFDYFHIGGFQSFVRRISSEMIQQGINVDYVLYGSRVNKEIEVKPKLRLRYFKTFKDAIDSMHRSFYDHIIHVRVPSYLDRFKIVFYYKKYFKHVKYHYISFIWSDSWVKRNLMFIEAFLNSKNGKIIAVSPRLYRFLKKRVKNVDFILPPVPRNYFLTHSEKPKNNKIKITFLGVIYPDKGIGEVIQLFKILKDNPRFETAIYGIYEPRNKQSVEVRNYLKNQGIIKYVEIDRYNYTSEVEDMVIKVLKETDIFIQPYRSLGATVDIPLLLLEAMASLCAVITTPIGSIPEIYGESPFLINIQKGIYQVIDFLKSISFEDIEIERKRIFEQNKKLDFETSSIVKKFLGILKGEL